MSKLTLFLVATMLGCACNNHIQVVAIQSPQMTFNEQKELIFENDTLRVRYDFFSEQGHVKFSILNKLNQPIYVNWRECAYIMGKNFTPYWQDTYVSNGYMYIQPFDWDGYFALRGPYTFSVAKRDEQIAFIPPGTELYQFEFLVKPGTGFGGLPNSTKEEVRQGKRNKLIGTKYKFTQTESPLKFRNYLTFSTDAACKSTFVLDTHFWISEVYKTQGKYVFGEEFTGHQSLSMLVQSHRQRAKVGANHFVLRDLEGIPETQGGN